MELILWPGCVSCALLAVSGGVQMARTKGGWREAAGWTAPLVFTSAALMLLVVLGTLALLPWLLIALVPLGVVAARAARAWREIAKLKGRGAATAAVLGLLAARLWDAVWNARENVRDLTGTLHPAPAAAPAAAAGRAPEAAPRDAGPKSPVIRQVPSLRDNAALGAAPSAAEVGVSLEAAGVAVPPVWAALAEYIRDFDPDDDEDELIEFNAGNAAGVLVLGEAFQDLAETLLTGTGLDPAYAMGFIDAGVEVEGLAEVFALLDRLYHDTYEDIHEHVEAGKTLPHNGRKWFHADGDAPEGGAVA